ncbi:putative uncharacterized protein [Coprobacillus sp. CAG:698]|nr:putative uncharacterized protein [Coprobacillus sp. CAG:698]
MTKNKERFEIIYKEGSQLKNAVVRQILVDKEKWHKLFSMEYRLCWWYYTTS